MQKLTKTHDGHGQKRRDYPIKKRGYGLLVKLLAVAKWSKSELIRKEFCKERNFR
jgi:hypothetical protein